MSKCGINRYKAGGRCGSMESGGGRIDNSQLGASFSAMLAARNAQDAAIKTPAKQYATPALTQLANNHAIVLPLTQKQVPLPESKQKDIDMILQGDFD